MKTTDTISVNPSKVTLGTTVKEHKDSILRSKIIDENYYNKSSLNLTNLMFSSAVPSKGFISRNLSIFRSLFAAILLICGINMETTARATGLMTATGIISITGGAFLGLGLLTRLSMSVLTAFYFVIGIISMRAGVIDMQWFTFALMSALFVISGSGKYSCDEILAGFFRKNDRSKRLSIRDKRLSYKAFRYYGK